MGVRLQRVKLPQLAQAFFDEFGRSADDRIQDYARACIAHFVQLGRCVDEAASEQQARTLLIDAYEQTHNYRAAIDLRERSNDAFHEPALRAIQRALTLRQAVHG